MELELLIAGSGLGKTYNIITDIEENRKNYKIVILTPEQNGYNFEKKLCEKFGGTFNIDVLNFNSFIDKISKKLNLENIKISDEIKFFNYLEISKKLKDRDNFLARRILHDINFIHSIDDIISELKEYNISIERLENYIKDSINIKDIPSEHIQKIKAIVDIYKEYQNELILCEKYDKYSLIKIILDSIDLLDFSEYIFYIDSYYNFSPLEYEIIEKLILKSKKVLLSINSDINRYINFNINNLLTKEKISGSYNFITLDEVRNEFIYSLDIYRKSHEVIANINNIIKRNSIGLFSLKSIVNYDNYNYLFNLKIEKGNINCINTIKFVNNRYKSSDLNYLVQEYPKIKKSGKSYDASSIKIIQSDNIELEVKQIAREINILKKSDKYSDEDFAIIYRNSSYEKYLDIFLDYGINVHLDKDINVENHRLIKLIFNILNYNNENYKESIMNILKTQLSNFEKIFEDKIKKVVTKYNILDIIDVENILKIKLINSYDDINSKFFTLETKEYTEEELATVQEILNDINKKIINILKSRKVDIYIKNIVKILNYFDIKMLLDKNSLDNEDYSSFFQEVIDRQVYTKFLKILENLSANFKDKEIEYNYFKELLLMSIKKIKYRNIPELNNSVVMAKMDLAKIENKKIVFILGFNKDILPKNQKNKDFLDEEDKEKMFFSDIILSPSKKSLMIDEEFVSYIAISRCREKLYISYSLLSENFNDMYPSLYLENIKRILPNVLVDKTSKILNFSLKYLNYYNNVDNLYIYKEVSFLYMKFIQSYKILINNDNGDNKLLKYLYSLIKKYNNIMDRYFDKKISINLELFKNLNDEKFFKEKENFTIMYYDIYNPSNEDNIDNNLVKKYIFNKKNFYNFSVSKITDFSNNPYLFFLKRILLLNDILTNEINVANEGNFFHAIMDDNRVKEFIENESDRISKLYDEGEIDEKISLLDIKPFLNNIINRNENATISNFMLIIFGQKSNHYFLDNIIKRLENAIKIEIKYMVITGYRFFVTELPFSMTLTDDFKNIESGDIYKKVKIIGKIDRVDKKGKNFLVIDYKRSKKDFSLKEILRGNISQIISYLYIIMKENGLKSTDVFGSFYREISDGTSSDKKFRLRGIVNEDLIFLENYSSEVMFIRVTKKGKIHSSDTHKSYKSKELDKLIKLNFKNIVNIIKEIDNFNFFNLSEEEQEEILFILANGEYLNISKKDDKYENISNKDLKKLFLEMEIY